MNWLEWLLLALGLTVVFMALLVFATAFGYEAACGFYRYLVRLARRWRARRAISKEVTDQEIQDWLSQPADRNS